MITTTAPNKGFASGGLTCKFGALCFYLSSVQVDSFVLRNPPERKARNRYMPYYRNITLKKSYETNSFASFNSYQLTSFWSIKEE